MSNKKIFWIAFFILSFCEFGQFAYSKNTTQTIEEVKLRNDGETCSENHTLSNEHATKKELLSYSLPR